MNGSPVRAHLEPGQDPEPGDYFCVPVGGPGGKIIQALEKLAGGFSDYQHCGIYLGDMTIVEAEPSGARCRKIRNFELASYTLWSTGAIPLTTTQRMAICDAARKYAGNCVPGKGVPYSALDYAAIAEYKTHLPIDVPMFWRDGGLRSARWIMADPTHMMCSQVVMQCYDDGGRPLLPGRPPGAADPADLAGVVLTERDWHPEHMTGTGQR